MPTSSWQLRPTRPAIVSKVQRLKVKPTGGWLSSQKCRFGIKFKKVNGEESGEQWRLTKLPNTLQKFSTDIYIANHTG
jgi:hypothetical protein